MSDLPDQSLPSNMHRFTLSIPMQSYRNRPPHANQQHQQQPAQPAPTARLKRPKEIACFSYDENHVYRADDSSIKYYYDPPLGASLSKGHPDKFVQLNDDEDEHLDGLLRTLTNLERGAHAGASAHYRLAGHPASDAAPAAEHSETTSDSAAAPGRRDVDLVAFRGMMTKLLTASYDRNAFRMNATCFQGTVFLEEDHGHKLAQRARQGKDRRERRGQPDMELMTYWGYKFEALALLPRHWAETSREFIESREEHVVNNAAQFCSVVETGAGGVSAIIAGEVDGVWDCRPVDPSDPVHWIELKTSAEIRNDRDRDRFEEKLLKFWAQSFLLGVPRIIVGFRTNDMEGKLVKVQQFETTELPNLVKDRFGACDRGRDVEDQPGSRCERNGSDKG
ncbi:hypothetical protein FH972_023656 [Carpinus fangiana]|uniref:Decapping nuclease n=1 Tax=Carpinus fangiana TaxID=176857 RepID=A0A5N6KW35_9ROSI|nr:hypothetical protein FH972_023656 [Carpinus fangiana]